MKNTSRFIFLIVAAILFSGGIALVADTDFMNTRLLPENYPVYVWRGGVVNRQYPGTEKRYLKTVNRFKGRPGCYVACYSRNKRNSVYPVGGGIYVMGQVRVSGRYIKRICNPTNYANKDISAANYFKNVCNTSLPEKCAGGCWAGGDTGGWFGVQRDGSIRRDCR